MALLIRLTCFNSYMEPTFLQVGMNSNLPQFKDVGQVEINGESDLKQLFPCCESRWGVEGAGLLQLPPTALIIVDPSQT